MSEEEMEKRFPGLSKEEVDRKFPGWDYPVYPGAKSTVADAMNRNVGTIPNKECVIFGDEIHTWKDEDEKSNRIANALIDLGVGRQENVAIMMRNCPEYMDLYLATWKLASIPANVNYRYVPRELHYLINQQETSTLFLTDDLVEVVRKIRPDLKHVKNYIVVGENVPEDMIGYEDLLKKYPKTYPKYDWEPPMVSDFLLNFYTGGTTGLPKGCLWRNDSVFGMLKGAISGIGGLLPKVAEWPEGTLSGMVGSIPEGIIEHKAIRTLLGLPIIPMILESDLFNDRILPPIMDTLVYRSPVLPLFAGGSKIFICSPLIHGGATASGLIASMLGAAELYLTAPSFDAKEACEIMEREKPMGLMAIGDAFYKPIADELDRKHYEIGSLLMGSVGVTWSPDVKRRLLKHIPGGIIADAFSATEAISPAFGISVRDEEIPYHTFESIKVDPKKGIRVVNPDTWEDVKPGSGEVGVWAVGGRMGVPVGYYGEPEKAKEVYRIIDGKQWNVFGDMCTVDKDGYVHFLSKDKEIINTGGEKVYAEEVEDTINENPMVRRNKVVSVPDERFTNAVTAVVELMEGEKATPEEIRDFCRDKLSGYKLPRHVYFIDRLPEQVSGKVEAFRVEKYAKEMWEKEGKPAAI